MAEGRSREELETDITEALNRKRQYEALGETALAEEVNTEINDALGAWKRVGETAVEANNSR